MLINSINSLYLTIEIFDMVTIQQLQYMITLSEEGSFNKASEKCFVTQPTMSMQVKKAEDILGYPVFDRSQQPIALTPFGERFIPIARDVINEYNQIEQLTKIYSGSHREIIRMGVIPTISAYLIPDLYQRWGAFSSDFQLVVEEMKTEELIGAMEEDKLDVAILSGPYHNPKFRVTKLFQEEILAYYPNTDKGILDTNDLESAHPWLLTPGNCLRTQIMHFCNLKTTTDDWDYQGGNMDMLMEMVDQYGGYTLIPEFYTRKKQRNFIRIVSEVGEVPAREIIALTKNRSLKWDKIEGLLREAQLLYSEAGKEYERFKLLNWS